MLFAVFPIGISSKYQILFELCIGSIILVCELCVVCSSMAVSLCLSSHH